MRAVERLPEPNPDVLGLPDMALMLTDVIVAFDHLRHTVTILANAYLDDETDVETAHARAVEAIRQVRTRMAGPLPALETHPARPEPVFESNMSREQFEANVARIVEYIRAGDAYQVVPSQRWSAPAPVEPFSIYRGLRAVNPSPYMYFLDFEDFQIVGASPEPLLTVSGRHVSTRPIAGTRPRGDDDAAIAAELLADEKERAEHVMLVDLGRNDLGRVCVAGSVYVERLMEVETYSHVLHIVSQVAGHAAAGGRRDRRAAQRAPGRHAVRRAQDPRDGDHRRARAGQARRLRRRGRLAVLRRRAGHLYLHPHRRGQGRDGAHPGRRRHRRRRQARLRVRGVPREGARRRAGDRAGGQAGGVAMRVLMVDNYDSFTYNLVQYLGELGADLEVVRNDVVTVDELLERGYDRVVVSPGPCTPNEAGISVEVMRRFPEAGVKTLGVCLGHQSMGQAFGGKVIRHEPIHGKTTEITHNGEGIFAGLPDPLPVARYHSLVVHEDLPDELEATAHGGGVLMAMRHRTLPAIGVQFHPESVLTPDGKQLLRNFLA